MSDGARETVQQPARRDICIKTWSRTPVDSVQPSHVHDQPQDVLEQYTRYLDQLESGESVVKHSVDYLTVSKASKALSHIACSTSQADLTLLATSGLQQAKQTSDGFPVASSFLPLIFPSIL